MDVKFTLVSLALLTVYGLVVCFALAHRTLVTMVLSLVGIPFALASFFILTIAAATPFEIIASIRRTRTLGKMVSRPDS